MKNLSLRSKTYEIWSKSIGSGGIPKNSKSKTPSADSDLRPRCEGSGKTKDLPTLGSRVEAINEIRNPPCGGGRVKGVRNSPTLNLVSKQTLEHP
ncbi:hypothetical protein AVEN_60840-1 [Araneus ventricosus]|uniref:Uncharacterized protein n=1 Tax=Araneus ventricosus TaxID=182803 RepID=A0A4Y2WTZ3_ARAVE|nr:hypothetical protein AVEN_182561-1 [Araneus ventricosus]GBO08464.1 hypothetical protein AVEN_182562-1 [Araneus ventricosus]GBO40943.1 hypothetical protein AVEN_250447-1 [Araneus ventricosus]GBO40945.1 hypothetical protein AVEN_60840-1 [Araneus ventricosus]